MGQCSHPKLHQTLTLSQGQYERTEVPDSSEEAHMAD